MAKKYLGKIVTQNAGEEYYAAVFSDGSWECNHPGLMDIVNSLVFANQFPESVMDMRPGISAPGVAALLVLQQETGGRIELAPQPPQMETGMTDQGLVVQ